MSIINSSMETGMHSKMVTGVYLFLVATGLLDTFFGTPLFPEIFMFDFWVYSVLFLTVLLFVRIHEKKDPEEYYIVRLNRRVLPALLGITVVLFGFDVYQHSETFIVTPEAVRATSLPHIIVSLGFDLKTLVSLIVLAFGFQVAFAPMKELQRWWQLYILSGFLLVCFFLSIVHPDVFIEISRSLYEGDDNTLMEALQVVILLFGAGITGYAAIAAKGIVKRMIYAIAAILLLVFAGEELSWGQHVFSFDYPVMPGNYQNEFNVHNQPGVNEAVVFMYVAAFLYAFFSWVAYRVADRYGVIRKSHRVVWDLVCFKGQEVFYFIPTLLFNPYFGNTMIGGLPSVESIYVQFGLVPDIFKTREFVHRWKETFEVVFYAGIVIHFYTLLYTRKPKTRT